MLRRKSVSLRKSYGIPGPTQYTLDLNLSSDTNTDALNEWIRSYPDQHFVLEQCGNPDAKQPPSAAWIQQIRQLAKNQNLSCKVSGLFTLSNWKSWKPADFYPFLDILFEAFGPNRLLYASDWPFHPAFRFLCAMEKPAGEIYGTNDREKTEKISLEKMRAGVYQL